MLWPARWAYIQPPRTNPPEGSSSGPPGACMMPSSEANVETMSFLMGALLARVGSELWANV